MFGSIEDGGQRRCCIDPEATDRTGFLRQMGLKLEITHRSKIVDVFIEVEANSAVCLVRVKTDTYDRRVISLSAVELRQHETIFGVDEIRNNSLVRKPHET